MISNKSLKNVQWLDTTLFMFFLTIIQSMIYGIAIMTMHWHFITCVNFIILIVAYGYSYWILKQQQQLQTDFQELQNQLQQEMKPRPEEQELLRQIKLEDVAYPSADEGIQTPDHFKGKQRNVTIAKSSRFEYI